jgi:hypothetical protein
MLRTALVLAAALGLASRSLPAQAHAAHRHPRGAKIIMTGVLVDPLCAFAQQLADSAQARCSRQRLDHGLQPALLTSESELYVLAFATDATRRTAATQGLVGTDVKVDGTVYPAGNAYLIVVDSIRPTKQ